MITEDYFQTVVDAMVKQGTYSSARREWTISRTQAQLILIDHMDCLHSAYASAPLLLDEGVRRGLWHIDIDHKEGIEIVVIP